MGELKKIYVNRKSDLSQLKQAYEAYGFRCYRVRTRCTCDKRGQGNSRPGLLVLDGDRLLLEAVKCKECTKESGPPD